MTYNAGNGVHTTDSYQARNTIHLVHSTGTGSMPPYLREVIVRNRGCSFPTEICGPCDHSLGKRKRTGVIARGGTIGVPLTASHRIRLRVTMLAEMVTTHLRHNILNANAMELQQQVSINQRQVSIRQQIQYEVHD